MNQKTIATITLVTGEEIKLELYPEFAPISVKNFVEYAESGFYQNTVFHRIIDNFMIQGGGYVLEGKSLKDKKGNAPIKGEFRSNGVSNTLKHTPGVISMARTMVKNSATSQFFICAATYPSLDGEYAAFGKTADDQSLDVVYKLSKVPTGYVGGMSDFPITPVIIKGIAISYID